MTNKRRGNTGGFTISDASAEVKLVLDLVLAFASRVVGYVVGWWKRSMRWKQKFKKKSLPSSAARREDILMLVHPLRVSTYEYGTLL